MARAVPSSVSPSEEQSIRAVLMDYCTCWNQHDMIGLAELFVDDAQWVNIVGMYWPSKAALVTGHTVFHRTFFQTTDIELRNVEIRNIAPDVSVAVILLKVGPFTPPDGTPRPASENRLSIILTKHDGRWRIVHGHNTVVDPIAQPFDPVKAEWPREAKKSAESPTAAQSLLNCDVRATSVYLPISVIISRGRERRKGPLSEVAAPPFI
jgi:uncharacterized protein (TIGR02246 family)